MCLQCQQDLSWKSETVLLLKSASCRNTRFVQIISNCHDSPSWVRAPTCHMSVGTGGSPNNQSVWWRKCHKTPLFPAFSAHIRNTFVLMLCEHMPCLLATRGRFRMRFLDRFSWQYIETAWPRVFTRHAMNCACLKNAWFYCARLRKWFSFVFYSESGALTTWQSAFFSFFFLGHLCQSCHKGFFESICQRHQARNAFHFVAPQCLHDALFKFKKCEKPPPTQLLA